MPILFHRRTADAGPPAELRAAVADYLDISRSPLRAVEPGWFALAEDAAWDRLRVVAGIAPARAAEPGATHAGDPALH